MTVFVDGATSPDKRGRLWAHLVADTLDELHAFAAGMGLRRSWFHADASTPHYDVTPEQRARAVELGAHAIDGRTLALLCRAWRSIKVKAADEYRAELLAEIEREVASVELLSGEALGKARARLLCVQGKLADLDSRVSATKLHRARRS